MPTLTATEILQRSIELKRLLQPCELCPRRCQINRWSEQSGFCGLGGTALLSTALPHLGEEPPLVGKHGSGTVFLAGCNAGCVFCQNYQISHLKQGRPVSPRELAYLFLDLQQQGCHNINWVTPTPHLPFLVEALAIAVELGLQLPLIYNSNGYLRLEVLQLLEGIVDIYLPDMKYAIDIWSETFSNLQDYVAINGAAVREMYRQVGLLQLDKHNIAQRGLIIRHLILPGGISGTRKIFQTIAEIDPRITVSIMAQYQPCYQAFDQPLIGRRITLAEYQNVLDWFDEAGLQNAFYQDLQDLEKQDYFFPDFIRSPENIFPATGRKYRDDSNSIE